MCIRRETREKARRSLAFSRVSKPHTHITHMLRQCTSIVYLRRVQTRKLYVQGYQTFSKRFIFASGLADHYEISVLVNDYSDSASLTI